MVLHMPERKERQSFGIPIIILVLVPAVSCLRMNAIKTTEMFIGLNSDGSITDDSDSPGCSDGWKMLLLSYSYHHMECPFIDQCSSLYNEPLQPADQLQLHQNCSLLDKCVGLHFLPALRRNNTNAVSIKYQCIDGKKFYNMCQNYTWTTNDSVYLTGNDNGWTFDRCQCLISGGKFTTDLSDIRLLDQNKGECYPAKFFVMTMNYSCDKKKENYGAIFNKPIEAMNPLVITLYPNSTTVLPITILVTIKPEMDIEVNCKVKHPERRNPFLATTETTPKDLNLQTDPTLTPKGTEKRETENVPGNYMTYGQGQAILNQGQAILNQGRAILNLGYFWSVVLAIGLIYISRKIPYTRRLLTYLRQKVDFFSRRLLTYLRQKVEGERNSIAEPQSVEFQTGNNNTDDISDNDAESTGTESTNVQQETQFKDEKFFSLNEKDKKVTPKSMLQLLNQ